MRVNRLRASSLNRAVPYVCMNSICMYVCTYVFRFYIRICTYL